MFYTVKIYNLANPSTPYMIFQFEASKLKMYWYVLVAAWCLSTSYKKVRTESVNNKNGYDIVVFEKDTDKDLIGITFEIDERVDADISLST